MKRSFGKFIVVALLGSEHLYANVCGTDYQSFNPTTNGIDFVTVQSSETLQPCIINMGVFLNYSANNLTYSQTLNSNFPKGQVRRARTFGSDLSLGMGLTDRWDIGVNFPAILNDHVDGGNYSFNQNGFTEFKVNSKYHFGRWYNFGWAGVISLNQNLIKNNPFTGEFPGPTMNYELVADTQLSDKVALGFNFGYRDRRPDDPISGVPFVPFKDQWIYSGALSYFLPDLDSKMIFEIYGSRAAQHVDSETDRNLNNLEFLVGAKHDYNQSLALHFGGATKLFTSDGGADWRIYAGLNWALGPVCEKNIFESFKREAEGPEVYTVDIQLLFEPNSDQIRPDRLLEFDKTYRQIAGQGFKRLVIEGHTDSVGAEDYNLDLSQRRANFVRHHLIQRHGVEGKKVEALGLGETRPIADNKNYQGRQRNRRVEFKFWR